MNTKLITATLLFSLAACSSSSPVIESPPTKAKERSCAAPQIREGFEVYEASTKKVRGAPKVSLGDKTYFLVGAPVVTSKDFVTVTESVRSTEEVGGLSGYTYFIEINAAARERFAKSTEKMIGRYMVIVQDGKAISAPIVHSSIRDGRFAYSAPLSAGEVKISEYERFCTTLPNPA